MSKFEINKHIWNEEIFNRPVKFVEVKKFINDLLSETSNGEIMEQLKIWNLRENFIFEKLEKIRIHHRTWNIDYNDITFVFEDYNATVRFTDKQMKIIERIVKGINVTIDYT